LTEQLPLPIRLDPPRPTLAQFDFGAQGPLQAELERRLAGQEHPPLLLLGPAGSGKSHLLAALSQAWSERDVLVRLLPLRDLLAIDPAALGLDGPDPTVWLLDDVDRVVGQRDWELALFALVNRQHDARQPLLASATALPEADRFAVPDLRSRLQQLTPLGLQPLDEAARHRLLARRAAALGLVLPDAVIDWLDVHFSRDLKRQLALLVELDRFSLSRGRRLTLPLVRECVARAASDVR
jgi:DnaA-homolog protein